MRIRVTSWPHIIATLVAMIGISGMCSAWIVIPTRHELQVAPDWIGLGVSALLITLSWPLATGREWARRVLLAAVIVPGFWPLVRYATEALKRITFSDTPAERQHAIILYTRFSAISSFLLTLAIIIFFMLFLCHPNVVRSFGRRGSLPEET